MIQIKEDLEICETDGINSTTVYMGSLTDLKKADMLLWRIADKETCSTLRMEIHTLKLSEIVRQLSNKCRIITIIHNEPLTGEIWQYGNYGDSWWKIGVLDGYT